MGVLQRINTLQELSDMGDNSTDITVEQLVMGALEDAFINMVKLLNFKLSLKLLYFCNIKRKKDYMYILRSIRRRCFNN